MFEFNESFWPILCPRNALSHLQWIPGSLPNRTAVIPLPFLIVDLLRQLKNIFGLAGRSYRPHIDPSCTCDSIYKNPFTKLYIYIWAPKKKYDNNFNGDHQDEYYYCIDFDKQGATVRCICRIAVGIPRNQFRSWVAIANSTAPVTFGAG